MTKKFMSLLLAVVMVIGLMPVMSIQAETSPVTILYKEDFNDFTTKAFNSDFSETGLYYVADDSGNNRLRLGKSLKADIIASDGYDGQLTDALKITVDSDGKVADTPGRMYLAGLDVANITDGAIVYEYEMYIPENDIGRIHMAPIVKSGDYYAVGTSSNDTDKRTLGKTLAKNQWYKFTYVHFAATQTTYCYVNDELDTSLITSAYAKSTAKTTFFLVCSNTNDFDYLIFDNFKIWHIAAVSDSDSAPQCITSAASTYAGLSDVAVTAQPKVTFTEMLLNAEIDDVATISDANIIMTTSDGSQTIPKTWEVSDDNKSITIKPNAVLEKGASYRVKLTGLKDMYDVTIPDYEFTFTTQEESPIVIKSGFPTFQKVSLTTAGTPETDITTLEKGYIRANLTVQNTSTKNKTQSLIMIAMLKDGNEIIGFQFKEGTLAPTEELTFDGGFWVTDADTQKIELLVWNSLSEMSPLTGKTTFDKTGRSYKAE